MKDQFIAKYLNKIKDKKEIDIRIFIYVSTYICIFTHTHIYVYTHINYVQTND